jgi:hypothetical protein
MARRLLNVRVDEDWFGRAKALIEHVQKDGELEELKATGNINRSAVIRLCLMRGMKCLEEKYRVGDDSLVGNQKRRRQR